MILSWTPMAMAQTPDNGDTRVSGVWQGTRTTTGGTGSGEYKIHSIRFDLKQSGHDISGSYKCYAGKRANIDCNNPVGTVSSGKIDASAVKLQVRALPNNLTCSFDGSIEASRMKGNYVCYVGGTLASNGVWEVHRR
ncbi:MAG: hypothetical protein WA823_15255 [Candidatus Acidiferrales bacterium]